MDETVLVVEDEADVADLLRYNLTTIGQNYIMTPLARHVPYGNVS